MEIVDFSDKNLYKFLFYKNKRLNLFFFFFKEEIYPLLIRKRISLELIKVLKEKSWDFYKDEKNFFGTFLSIILKKLVNKYKVELDLFDVCYKIDEIFFTKKNNLVGIHHYLDKIYKFGKKINYRYDFLSLLKDVKIFLWSKKNSTLKEVFYKYEEFIKKPEVLEKLFHKDNDVLLFKEVIENFFTIKEKFPYIPLKYYPDVAKKIKKYKNLKTKIISLEEILSKKD